VTVDVLFVAWNRLAFTQFSWKMLMRNTDWSLVSSLHVHDDGSEDGTAEWLDEAVKEAPVPFQFRVDPLRSPPAVMNRYVARSEVEWFAKVDNDIVMPPGWLGDMLGVIERNPEVELLGTEAGRMPCHPDWDGVYRFEDGSHMGGVGLIRVASLVARPRMAENQGRQGWTQWQHEYQPVRGWMNPDPGTVSLDRVPFEPWLSLSQEYVDNEWQRSWGTYHERSDYWDWWPDEARR
jgi:glycosyltransferase involved in cell wall biosynthesis